MKDLVFDALRDFVRRMGGPPPKGRPSSEASAPRDAEPVGGPHVRGDLPGGPPPIEMLQIADRVVTEEELVFPRGPRVYLGHNATFERCRLHFNSRADCVTLARSRFVDCDIYADRPMKKALWTACDVIGCRFHGRFQDNDFGHWPGFWLSGMTGSIADCDFTDAELHFIRFFGCDITSLQLPGWPCFTLIDPRQAFEPIGRMAGPPEWLAYFDAIHGEMARQEDPCLTAMTYHAPTLAKWLSRKVRVTEADLRAFVEGYSGAVL